MADREIVGTNELVAEVGVSRQMITVWAREGLAEAAKLGRGKWHRERAIAWIADRREDSPKLDGEGAAPGSMNEARTRLYQHQGTYQELRNSILTGNLLLRDTVEQANREEFAALVEIGDRWVALGRNAVEQKQRQELWHDLRNRFVECVERLADTYARGEDVKAARVLNAG